MNLGTIVVSGRFVLVKSYLGGYDRKKSEELKWVHYRREKSAKVVGTDVAPTIHLGRRNWSSAAIVTRRCYRTVHARIAVNTGVAKY